MNEKKETKEILKSKKTNKFYFGEALKIIGATLATAVVMCGAFFATNFDIDIHNLPSQEDVTTRLMQIYGDQDKMFLLGGLGDVQRLPCPKKNETVKINVQFSPNDMQKLMMEDAVEELNEVFAIINPNYKFSLNYNPTFKDSINPYSINVKQKVFEETERTPGPGEKLTFPPLGLNHSIPQDRTNKIEGDEIYYSNVILNSSMDSLKHPLNFRTTFLHEICHSLGLGDAYLNENASEETLMQRADKQSLSKLDLYTLDALYRADDRSLSDSQVYDFIENYESHSQHTQEHLKKLIVELQKLIDEKTWEKFNYLDSQQINDFLIEKYGDVPDVQDFMHCYAYRDSFEPPIIHAWGKHFGELLPKNANDNTNFRYLSIELAWTLGGDVNLSILNIAQDFFQGSYDHPECFESFSQNSRTFFSIDIQGNQYINLLIGEYCLALQYDGNDQITDIILMKETHESLKSYFQNNFEKISNNELTR